MPRKKLVLIDGMSNVFRAYYAIRGLSNRQGMPTNAVFGFTTMLRKVLNDEKPDYLAVAFDTAAPTFRHEMYPQYKANRTAMPDDLSLQMPYIFQVCEALRVPVLRLPGYEADDIIGTLARRAEQQELNVVIVSSDKDLCQLVDDHIVVVKADRQTATVYDANGVQERLGVRPDQVVDLLALWGDSSDNVPGAPGIGEKGSQQIIQQFGSLEKALDGWEQVQKKVYRESLRDHKDLILHSRELVTIRTDAPIDVDVGQLQVQRPDPDRTYTLFNELNFASLAKDFIDLDRVAPPASEATPAVEEAPHRYQNITSSQDARLALDHLWSQDRLAFVLDLKDGDLRGLGFSTRPSEAGAIDFHQTGLFLEDFKDAFEYGLLAKTGHDLKQAVKLLKQSDLQIEGRLDDVMIAGWLLDPNGGKYDLATLAQGHLRVETGTDFSLCRQADLVYRLIDVLRDRLAEKELDRIYEEMELPLIEILAEMELAGVRVDPSILAEVSEEIDIDVERLTKQIHQEAGQEFNINSPQQLAEVFDKLNISVTRKTKKTGRISTDAFVLEGLAPKYPIARHVLDYRELAKLKGTYVNVLPKLINPETRRIHTTFDQTGTSTGRLSSKTPNLQHIPVRSALGREVRKAFVAERGHKLLSADYSQIDLRVLAHTSGDEAMMAAFREGRDIHAEVARTVFGAKTEAEEKELRRSAKIVNFAIAYGIGAFGLAQRVGLPRREAQQVIDNYYQTYPGVRRYMEETPREAREKGYVRSLCGRIRQIPDIKNKNFNLRARAEREAINAPIQGGSADIFKLGMIRVHRALKRMGLKARMILQVHDELLLEVPERELDAVRNLVKEEMERAYELKVPLVVEIGVGENWLEVH